MADPVRPHIYAHFQPELVNARVFANFTPTQPAKVYASFEPEVYERAIQAAGLVPPIPEPPFGPPLSDEVLLLQQIRDLMLPDNTRLQLKFVTAQVSVSVGYDYAFPPWARHFVLTNRSAGSGAAGQLYYWFNQPAYGGKTLPQYYATLVAGQSLTENAGYQVLTVFADSTMTDQGWEIRFEGYTRGQPGGYIPRPEGAGPLIIAPGGGPIGPTVIIGGPAPAGPPIFLGGPPPAGPPPAGGPAPYAGTGGPPPSRGIGGTIGPAH